MDPKIAEKVKESFSRQAYMRTISASITQIDQAQVEIQVPITRSISQQQGFAHAAVAFGIGDSAAGYAALTLLPIDQEVVTSEMKVNLLAPAVGDRLIAKGSVVKAGRRLIVVQAHVFAQAGEKSTLVALMQGTMVPVDL